MLRIKTANKILLSDLICVLFSSLIVSVGNTYKEQQGNIKTKIETDLCVYAVSCPGVAAATAAVREGMSVIIIKPASPIGGAFRIRLQVVPHPDHL